MAGGGIRSIYHVAFAVGLGLLAWLPAAGSGVAEDAAGDADQGPAAAGALPPAPGPDIRWRPASALQAADNPNDSGHGIALTWALSPDDSHFLTYEVSMARGADARDSAWIAVGSAPRGSTSYVHQDVDATMQGKPNAKFVPTGQEVYFKIRGRAADGSVSAWTPVVSAVARGNWFHKGKTNVLVATLLLGAAMVWFITAARRGKPLYIRPVSGIAAVDEAIGRATEMGRPILFVLGTGTAGEIGTIAGYTVLARVAKRTADYQTPILVPVNDPVMLAMAQETVRQAYIVAGRPDLYRPGNVFYISAMQFPYVAAVNGLMQRERTATNFYMGVFRAESLLLAEAGNVTGAIQISGTDQLSQIPFFVAATDYTLIGEELYAASAYLSQEPILMGPLKAQDWAKMVILALLVAGVAAATFFHSNWFVTYLHAV